LGGGILLLWEFGKMANNLLHYNFELLTLITRRKKKSREDRSIGNNLVKFADNLPFSYFKAPQKQQHFDEK